MKSALLLVSLVLAAVPAFADQNPMKPGMWEITSRTDMPGMPYKVPPVTFKHCVTAAMLAQNQGLAEPHSPPGTHCERVKFKMSGNHAEWGVSCTGKTNVSGEGSMTWDSPDSYHGQTHMTMDMDGHTMNMTQTMQGRRLGDCSK